MTFQELKDKAVRLPLEPGVYIMRDKGNNVIYVGKAKKLKNRVSQYFQDTASHSPKTKLMVSKIDHFDVIIAASEFEALVLECSLIKRYLPKYNILLKDDKGYPYIRLSIKDPYPLLEIANELKDDGAVYFGPFGSRGRTQDILDSIRSLLKLPTCGKVFPRDIGKSRPCLNFHMNQCSGWCQQDKSQKEYRLTIERARQLLLGNYKQVANEVREQMNRAAEDLNFEVAASLRDCLRAIDSLGKKQFVTAGSPSDSDVIGFAQTESKACFSVLHFNSGNLMDKDYEIFPVTDDAEEAVSALMKQYYLSRGIVPKNIYIPFSVNDASLFQDMLEQKYGRKVNIRVPMRGDNVRLVELANKNALEEAQRVTTREERTSGTLNLLGKMLSVSTPVRIESFDISNISGTDIVAGMVVFLNGRAKKSEYKRFKIEGLAEQDDYASMRQVIQRRFTRYLSGDKGFACLPDLLLIDGGVTHAKAASEELCALKISVPVFGMVKDNRHRTRALVTPDGEEIQIDMQPAVFSFIGNIQEETHRFAISYHRSLRSKRLKYSELDGISGIGTKRKQDLLKKFKSISAIRNAPLSELEKVLPSNAAASVYEYYRQDKESG